MANRIAMISIFGKLYQHILFDLDGVLLDTNFIKENNIYNAARQYANEETATKFSEYFTSLNGVPRETKINAFFPDKAIANDILEAYNTLNTESLFNADITEGATDILEQWYGKVPMYVVSGGSQVEIREILKRKGIDRYFQKILGGPVNKDANVRSLSLSGNTIFFGDSKVDYDVATEFACDFIFVYQYTQFKEWELFFTTHSILKTIKNLKAINHD